MKNGKADPLPFSNVKLGPLLTAVDGFLEFGSGRKLCYLPGSDLDGGARLWVTPIAGLSLRYREGAETNQRYPITFFQGSRNAVYGCVDCGSRLRFTDAATRCDSVNEIGFVHRLSWQVSLSSKGAGREHSLSEKPGGLI
jgi:hypothetical protein